VVGLKSTLKLVVIAADAGMARSSGIVAHVNAIFRRVYFILFVLFMFSFGCSLLSKMRDNLLTDKTIYHLIKKLSKLLSVYFCSI